MKKTKRGALTPRKNFYCIIATPSVSRGVFERRIVFSFELSTTREFIAARHENKEVFAITAPELFKMLERNPAKRDEIEKNGRVMVGSLKAIIPKFDGFIKLGYHSGIQTGGISGTGLTTRFLAGVLKYLCAFEGGKFVKYPVYSENTSVLAKSVGEPLEDYFARAKKELLHARASFPAEKKYTTQNRPPYRRVPAVMPAQKNEPSQKLSWVRKRLRF